MPARAGARLHVASERAVACAGRCAMTSPSPMVATPSIVIRRAEPSDAPALGRLGAALVRAHHAFDHDRFLPAGTGIEAGYGRFLTGQFDDQEIVILVAERDGQVVGYAYAGVEPRSWKELR